MSEALANPVDFKSALQERLARRAELSVAALDAVADYDWDVVARNVVSVYETVVLGRSTVSLAQ